MRIDTGQFSLCKQCSQKARVCFLSSDYSEWFFGKPAKFDTVFLQSTYLENGVNADL